jgi:hypothetical protein
LIPFVFNIFKRKQPAGENPPGEERPLTMDALASMLITAAKNAGYTDSLEYDPATSTIQQGLSGRTYIGNFYNDYLQAKGPHRDLVFSNFLAILNRKTDPVSLEEAKSKVVAAVRERALFSLTSLHWEIEGGRNEPIVAFEPVSDWFARCMVLDFPGYVALVMENDLKRWELFEIGLARLHQCTVPKFQQENGFFRGTWGDDYDSSRLLLPGVFGDLPLDGDPVVCIPNRNLLLVTGSNDHQSISAMLQAAEEIIRTKSRPMNPGPLILKDGSIHDFAVPVNSPIFNNIGRASRLAPLMYYQQQQATLGKLYEQNGKDHFIADYKLNQWQNGKYASFGVWSNTVRTLLPKTDLIAFFDPQLPEPQRSLGLAKWDDVVNVAGDLMLDTQMFPPRYYVSKFPTNDQLAPIPRPPQFYHENG